MDYIDKAVKVFQQLAEDVGQEALLVAHNATVDEHNVGQQGMGNISIPILTNDRAVKKYVEDFGLQKPENMIRFFVEASFAAFESTKESINELKEIDLKNSIARVWTAEDQIKDAMNNKREEAEELRSAKHNLDQAINELQNKIEISIDGIRKIDNRSKWQFFLKSKVSVTDIDTYVHCAEYALQALIMAVELQKYIAAYKKTETPATIDRCSQFISEKILEGDTCSLMHAYDKDKQAGFWIKIGQKCDSMIRHNNCLIEYAIEYDNANFS